MILLNKNKQNAELNLSVKFEAYTANLILLFNVDKLSVIMSF